MSESILKKLREDHRQVLHQLDDYERSSRGSATSARLRFEHARQLVERLEQQFNSHMAAEDDVLLPALARRLADGESFVAPLREEHQELRAILVALSATLGAGDHSNRDEQIAVQLRDLTDLLRIHIRKEETLVFSIAERLLSPREFDELEARRRPSSQHPAKGNTE